MSESSSPVKHSRSRRPVALAGATLAATALTAAIAPPATPEHSKLDILLAAAAEPVTPKNVQPAITVGPIGGLIPPLLNALGVANPYQLPLPVIDPFTGPIAWDFVGGAPSTRGIYNLINNLIYKDKPADPVLDNGLTCKNATQDKCRTAFLISTGYGALGANDAIHGLIDQAEGKTPLNFDPLKPNPSGSGLTQVSGIFLNNILRPDGGFDSRFPMLVEPFGVSATMPGTGEFGPNSGQASVFNWIESFTWPYNTLADFPITFSPLAIANSVFGALPPPSVVSDFLAVLQAPDKPTAAANVLKLLNKAAGTTLVPDGEGGFISNYGGCPVDQCGNNEGFFGLGGGNLANTVGLGSALQGNVYFDGETVFGPQDVVLGAYKAFLPLTAPLYVNSLVVNSFLKQIKSPYLLGTPAADIITPALKILINTAYPDVIAPDRLDVVNPRSEYGKTYAELGYQAYDRTFYQDSTKPVNFQWSNNPALTPDEQAAVSGDVSTAFSEAVKAQSAKPYFGIIVPNPDSGGTPITPPAAVAAAAVPAQVEEAPPAVIDTPPAEGAPDNGGSTGHSARAAKTGNNDNAGGGSRGHRGSHD